MPNMRKPHPVAVLCADLHLSSLQPSCRADDDWFAVQANYLKQVKEAADGVPVICAGDIFDRWNPNPETINFALEHLPDRMICVPGQHDLPNHRFDQMHRSGYGVLVAAKKIIDISYGAIPIAECSHVMAHGFAWGQEIESRKEDHGDYIHLAVVHRYIWTIDHSYPGAPEEGHLSAFKKQLKGYDAAIFGDNHKGFLSEASDCNVLNCGGFIRRKSDEIDYVPKIGVLYSDGSITRKALNTEGDRFHADIAPKEEVAVNMQAFIDGLEALGEHGLNFKEAVENHLRGDEIEEPVKEMILKALE